jgi:hypothetical protein
MQSNLKFTEYVLFGIWYHDQDLWNWNILLAWGPGQIVRLARRLVQPWSNCTSRDTINVTASIPTTVGTTVYVSKT